MKKLFRTMCCAFFFISGSLYAADFLKVGQTKLIKVNADIDTVAVGKNSAIDYQVIDDKTIILIAKAEGESFVTITDKSNNELYHSDFIVSNHDINFIQKGIIDIDNGSNVNITKSGDEYLATGVASSDDKVIQICDYLRKTLTKNSGHQYNLVFGDGSGSQQYKDDSLSSEGFKCLISSNNQGKSLINVKIKILSVDKAITDRLGIQWQDILGSTGSYKVGQGFSNITGIISVLTQNTGSKVLSEPNISVLPGEQAGFHSGGELPVITMTRGGDPSVSFKKYGISLSVVANLINDKKIRVFLDTELSARDETNSYKRTDGSIMPALKTQSANTIVNINDGDSFIIGGLKSEEKDTNDVGVSFFSKIPVIGGLFKTSEDNQISKEILIIATVNKVNTKSASIHTPYDEFIPLLQRHFNIKPSEKIETSGPDLGL